MTTTTTHRPIVADALKCDELRYQFLEVCCVDDKCEIDDYSDLDILSEALYVHNKYMPGYGWMHYDMLVGDNEHDAKIAHKDLLQLKRFLKKWRSKVDGEPNPMGCSSPN